MKIGIFETSGVARVIKSSSCFLTWGDTGRRGGGARVLPLREPERRRHGSSAGAAARAAAQRPRPAAAARGGGPVTRHDRVVGVVRVLPEGEEITFTVCNNP